MSDEVVSPMNQIKALNAYLQVARHAYYVDSRPIMPDELYDAKERELRALAEAYPAYAPLATVLQVVGSDLAAASLTQPIKHKTPMLSLENAFTIAEVEKWTEKHPPETTYTVEPKIDGGSLSVRYNQWNLWLATTRGDGAQGEDVTQAALNIEDIPHQIDHVMFPHDLEIRGEVFMTRQQFARINAAMVEAGGEPYKTSRNLANGTMKLKDPKEVAKRGLRFQPWHVYGGESQGYVPDTAAGLAHLGYKIPQGLEHSQRLEWFAQWTNTRQYQGMRVYDKSHLAQAIESARILRDTLWAEIIGDTDGIVIKVEERWIREELGENNKVPNWAIAFKFPAERAVTLLNGITWQVGRTGKLTPVAELEPVLCGGTMNARASLSNPTYMAKLGVCIGDRVSIFRGGEVIPQVEGVAEECLGRVPTEIPTMCPECAGPLQSEVNEDSGITQLYCTNHFCPGRLISHLTYLGSRACLDIDGLGDVLAEQFIREGVVYNLGSLWEWANETQAYLFAHGEDALRAACEEAGFPPSQTLTVISGCDKAKTAGWDVWLMALGIPGIAKELSKALAAFLALGPGDLLNLPDKIFSLVPKQVDGLGPERIKDMQRWAQDPRAIQNLQQLYDTGVRPTCTIEIREGPQPLAGEIILVTGDLGPEREHLRKQLESLGAVTKTTVSKKLTLILAGEGAGGSKLAKAQELQIRVEGKEWLVKVFAQAGLELESRGMDDIPDAFANL